MSEKNFELIAYSTTDRNDAFSPYFKPLFLKWNSIEKKKDEKIVEQIFKDGIHILMDLQGHSAKNRLPIFFYKCLKLKFADIENKYLILFSSLIFLSPTFRSLAIWPDSRLWGLTFFVISIYYFLSYKNDKDFKNCLLTVLFYSIGSYFSPNFSVLSVFFILYFLR